MGSVFTSCCLSSQQIRINFKKEPHRLVTPSNSVVVMMAFVLANQPNSSSSALRRLLRCPEAVVFGNCIRPLSPSLTSVLTHDGFPFGQSTFRTKAAVTVVIDGSVQTRSKSRRSSSSRGSKNGSSSSSSSSSNSSDDDNYPPLTIDSTPMMAETSTSPKDEKAVRRTQDTSLKVNVNENAKLERDIVALEAFLKLHGHLRVPYYYIIPDHEKGVCSTNMRIRRKAKPVDLKQQSAAVSFHDLPPTTRPVAVTRIRQPLIGGKATPATRTLISPDVRDIDDDMARVLAAYPKEVRGLRLGLRVARIRKGQLYTREEQRARLRALGLPLPVPVVSGGEGGGGGAAVVSVSTATSTNDNVGHRKLREDCSTSSSTSTSSSSSSSSSGPGRTSLSTNKLNVGVGLVDDPSLWSTRAHAREQGFQRIMAALEAHQDLFGDTLVPRYFTVPSQPPWPQDTWGMQLGNRVRNIRARRAYNASTFHQRLEALGFDLDLSQRNSEPDQDGVDKAWTYRSLNA